jgi:hypothetical protein
MEGIIFSHEFAKALWGERNAKCDLGHDGLYDKNSICRCGADITVIWQYHLQKMVLEEKPVMYLAKFVSEGVWQLSIVNLLEFSSSRLVHEQPVWRYHGIS